MKKGYFFILFLFLLTQSLSAQENKVRMVVLDPTMSGKSFEEGTEMIIREMVSSAIVNTGKYSIIERSLIDKILQEQNFSRSGLVDDNQIVELGKMAGADKVFLSVLSSSGGKGMLSLKLVDVRTAGVERQAAKLVEVSEVLNIITDLTLEALGEVTSKSEKTNNGISSILGLNQSKKTKPEASTRPAQSKQQPKIESNELSNYQSPSGEEVVLFFAGNNFKKNPTAKIFVDGILVGSGTFNEGFSVSFVDNQRERHQVTIEWTAVVSSKTYNIDTSIQKKFEFEYKKGGFGYEFRLKD